jgi:hypothetical protein
MKRSRYLDLRDRLACYAWLLVLAPVALCALTVMTLDALARRVVRR